MEHVHLYRKESLERIESPEQMNQILRVTNPSVWLLLTAVILLLVGLLVWGSFTYIDDEELAEGIEPGMLVTVGETSAEILSLGHDEQGIFALAETDLSDGVYEAGVRYKQTQILRLLFR